MATGQRSDTYARDDSRPAAGRRLGQVRKSLDKENWSARFQFTKRRERLFFEGPLRACRGDAEADRNDVAAAVVQVPRPSRLDATVEAIKRLRGEKTLSGGAPGTASTSVSELDFKQLDGMNKKQLRSLATRTPGIARNKKNAKGKWVPKTKKELVAELGAKKTSTATQALPGRCAAQKRRASSLPGRRAAPKRVLRRRTGKKRLATPVSGSIKAEKPVSDSIKAERQASDGIGGHSRRTKKRPASTNKARRT